MVGFVVVTAWLVMPRASLMHAACAFASLVFKKFQPDRIFISFLPTADIVHHALQLKILCNPALIVPML